MRKHLVKACPRQQTIVALPSAEAELHFMVAASAETLCTIALGKYLGKQFAGDEDVDSSAATGVSHRVESGKRRHVKIQAFWVQEV